MDVVRVLNNKNIVVHNYLNFDFLDEIANDILIGLTAKQKNIPSKYFYDDRGSDLFDQICDLPEYYVTRTELSLLEEIAESILGSFQKGNLIEFGSGSNRKIKLLLQALTEEQLHQLQYVPIDISEGALVSASNELQLIYPELKIYGLVADFTRQTQPIPQDQPKLMLFLGSTLGNFEDSKANHFLSNIAYIMNKNDRLLISCDMIKPAAILESAYNDSQGVTAEFNKNALEVINKELNANFDLNEFSHVAFFNKDRSQIEMHLSANSTMTVNIKDLDLTVQFNQGESIHTEICRKFTKEMIETMTDKAGLKINNWYSDSKEWFSIVELVLK